MKEIPAQAVIDRLLKRISRLEYELAVARLVAEQALHAGPGPIDAESVRTQRHVRHHEGDEQQKRDREHGQPDPPSHEGTLLDDGADGPE